MRILVVVDVQAAFAVPPDLPQRIAKFGRRFERRVFTRFVNPAGSLFRCRLQRTSCAPGSADTELLVEAEPGDLIFEKAGYGLPPRALAKLKRLGVRHATVCGIDTDACVLGVMFSLFDAGIPCRAKEDLCWSSSGLHREALKIINEQFPQRKR